jgi:hypothetical protein
VSRKATSLNHLSGLCEERVWHREAKRFCSLEIDDEIEFGRLPDLPPVEPTLLARSANQGMTTVMTPSLTSLLLIPSRAIDSMTDHFCRNRADASCTFSASTLTQHARRPPSLAI